MALSDGLEVSTVGQSGVDSTREEIIEETHTAGLFRGEASQYAHGSCTQILTAPHPDFVQLRSPSSLNMI